MDGLDLWPLLTQGKALDRDALLLAGTPQRAAIRMGDWKLLLNPVRQDQVGTNAPEGDIAPAPLSDIVELYNLADDISETNDLAAAQPERVKAMRARLDGMLKGAAPSLAVTNRKVARPTNSFQSRQ